MERPPPPGCCKELALIASRVDKTEYQEFMDLYAGFTGIWFQVFIKRFF